MTDANPGATTARAPIRAPHGTQLSCRGWQQEAALRMLMNNLDPEVAERPQDLVVYGGAGKAARDWASFDAIVATLRRLEDDETLLVQSRQAGRRLPDARLRAARADRQRQPRARLGELGRVPPARCPGADDVRPDDGRQLDLHRHAGHPAGHLRDLRRRRRQALRRHAQGDPDADRRPRRHGRRAAAGGHHERGRRPLRGGRPRAHPAPPRPRLPRQGDRVARRGAGLGRRGARRRHAPQHRPAAPTPPTSIRSSSVAV